MSNAKRTRGWLLSFITSASLAATLNAASSLQVVPSEFDFGWAPDNSKITADFAIKNIGIDMIPVMSVQPTCGCTASNFTPADLASNQETKVSLTFNTRGYANSSFNKAAQVKTDTPEGDTSVRLKGYVLDPTATVFPSGTGIAEFLPGSKDKKTTIKIENKSAADVELAVIQPAASWAKVKLDGKSIKAGQSMNLDISIDGSVDEERATSVTFASAADPNQNRFTVAIRTGTPPPAVRKYVPPAPKTDSKPATPKDKK